MFKSKYSTALTVILILLIIAIIVVISMVGVNVYKNYETEKQSKKAYAELLKRNDENENIAENEVENENNLEENAVIPTSDNNTTTQPNETTTRPRTRMYNQYPMAGYIKIEKTQVEYPILLDVSPGALETAVGVMYPSNPELNKPGNVVIIGHNFRNGKFFSNNKNLQLGDKIQITDLTGKTLTYIIYEINQTTKTDTEYITRERGDNIEISLSTCTDDGNDRLVILAKVQ